MVCMSTALSQVQADEVADHLKQAGISASAYHAGKHMEQRLRVQVRVCSHQSIKTASAYHAGRHMEERLRVQVCVCVSCVCVR